MISHQSILKLKYNISGSLFHGLFVYVHFLNNWFALFASETNYSIHYNSDTEDSPRSNGFPARSWLVALQTNRKKKFLGSFGTTLYVFVQLTLTPRPRTIQKLLLRREPGMADYSTAMAY